MKKTPFFANKAKNSIDESPLNKAFYPLIQRKPIKKKGKGLHMTAVTSENLDPTTNSQVSHEEMANCIRALVMDAVQKANSGHPGMPMGFADVATVLFTKFLNFDPNNPDWPNRDRFVLSVGHGSMLLYSLLYLTGYPDMTMDQIKDFRQLHSRTAGHPEFGEAPGIETTTGPLGQGIGNAVGMALAERAMNARFGDTVYNHYTYCVVGDGCLMEGISHEAVSMAGHLQLSKLIVLFDDNHITIDGPTDLSVSDDQCKRFEASGWHVQQVDGHNPEEIAAAIKAAQKSDKPSMIACRTIIGYGAPTKQGTSGVHGAPLGEEEIAAAREQLGWTAPPFEIPQDYLAVWRQSAQRGQEAFAAWQQELQNLPADKKQELDRLIQQKLPEGWKDKMQALIDQWVEEKPKLATRASSGKVLDVLTQAVPELVGGSADLTGSNNTKAKDAQAVKSDNLSGNYMYYGVREHGMAAAMNGVALYGGLIPFGGTFFVFTDYCRPAIRLSALMKQRVVYVMTHDSIGLGEDGPTHQPVEHLAAMRAMPNINIFRPADAVEVAECWMLAVEQKETPSMLCLTRQGVPALRTEKSSENKCAKGAYILKACEGVPKATLLATGSEVHLALEAQTKLAEDGIPVNVVSMPCWELFEQQDADYKNSVLGEKTLRVAIEAGLEFGWDRYLGQSGHFIGMESFGASAPANQLYEYFGITTDNIVKTVKDNL